jgi:hypothetical protein
MFFYSAVNIPEASDFPLHCMRKDMYVYNQNELDRDASLYDT